MPAKRAASPFAHLFGAREATTPRIRAPGGLEDCVLREEGHDAVEIVAIERVCDSSQGFGGDGLRGIYLRPS
jgi:hypothetical protein